jgi:hypothetical protein
MKNKEKNFIVSRAGFSQEDPDTSPGAREILCGGQRKKIAIFVVEIFFVSKLFEHMPVKFFRLFILSS